MSRRADNPRRNQTAAEAAIRAKQEAQVFELGWPLCPEQYAYNDKPLWAAWKQLGTELFERRLLGFCDGPALLELARAHKNGQQEVLQQIHSATWESREPFPDPNPPTEHSLADFLESVRRERETFLQRIVAGQTVCTVAGDEPYAWPAGKPATVARQFALEVTQGTRVAGELVIKACNRFLQDLEHGHERGLAFDPVAVKHICQFAEVFCNLALLPWQVFVLANIFGWKKPSGARRFTEAWLSTAKKSGKTKLASVVALWGLVCDQEKYPDVFSAATKKDQSRLVWRDAKRTVQDNAELREYVRCWAGALQVAATDGTFTPLSADEKSMDGLRPHFILADEVAFWDSREQWDKLVKGLVSRIQPLVLALTTAGSTKNCFAFGKFDLGEKILRGIFNEDSTFVAIFSIDKTDDPMDEKFWAKSNPSLGVTLQIEHLRKTRDEVLQDPSGLNAWLQYHCNVWPEVTLVRQGSIPAPKWDACAQRELVGAQSAKEAVQKFLELNADTPVFLGVDIGLTSDTSAVAMLWPRARFIKGGPLVGKRVAIVQTFIPELGLIQKEKDWQVPLSTWARAGWIELMPGDITDVRLIKKHIVELNSKFAVRELGFDPWQFRVAAAELSESGISCVEVPQVPSQTTAPCRELISAIHKQELVHFGNPVLTWFANNVVLVESEKTGGLKPEKLSPAEKIDGISAIVTGWQRMLLAPPPPTGRIRFI